MSRKFTTEIQVNEIATPSTPDSGTAKLYPKSDGKWYTLDDTGSEVQVGAGAGNINYLSANPDSESSTTGWTMYEDAAGSSPVDGTGTAVSIESTWTRDTTSSTYSPLRGTSSFLFTKTSGASRQGEGVSYDFTINKADLGQVLELSFDYYVASGTYASGDLSIWVIADPSGTPTVIQPTPYTLPNVSIPTKWKASFQTLTTTTSYRLCIHVGVSTNSANTLRFDNFSLGPQVKSYGPYISDWTSCTVTLNNTTSVVNQASYCRRVGDSLELVGQWTYNAGGGGTNLLVTIPSGYTIDTTKIPNGATYIGNISGTATWFDTSATRAYTLTAYAYSSTQLAFTDSTTANNLWDGTLAANGDYFSFAITLPILGWSSSMILSSDSGDSRVVAFSARGNPTASAINGTANFIWASGAVLKDTHGAYNSTTGVYTVQVPGDYVCGARVVLTGTEAVNSTADMHVYLNGSVYQTGTNISTATSLSGTPTWIDCVIPNLKAGDTLEFRGNSNITGVAVGSDTYGNKAYIYRLSGNQQIAAAEKVAAYYTTNAAQNLTTGTTGAIDFEDKYFDSHGSVSGTGTGFNGSWKWTAPRAGYARVNSRIVLSSSTSQTDMVLFVYKNGTLYSELMRMAAKQQSTTNNVTSLQGSDLVDVRAGDYIEIRAVQSSGGSIALSSGADDNYAVIYMD